MCTNSDMYIGIYMHILSINIPVYIIYIYYIYIQVRFVTSLYIGQVPLRKRPKNSCIIDKCKNIL